MRVLQINSVCGYGSTGKIVADLYHELKQLGYDCCVAYGRGTASADIQSYRIGSDVDVYTHGIISRVTDQHAFYSMKTTKRFVRWMKEYDPDVIHLHNVHGYYINIEVLFEALKQMDKPVVWTLHDCWAFTGHCSHFEHIGCDKWKTGCFRCPQKRDYPSSILIDNSRNNYKRKKAAICALDRLVIVTPSEWLKAFVEESFLKSYQTRVIHNGIDLNVFRPMHRNLREKYGLQDKKIILGVASIWSNLKGLGDFIQLADLLEPSYQIVLIGHINGQKVEKQNITYIDRTSDREELAAWYTEADIFFNPTYQDTFPTVNLEAQACGTPVITYDTGGSPEGVLDGCGCVCQQGDLQSVVQYIHRGLHVPTLYEKIDVISKEKMMSQYMELFHYLKTR